VAPATAPASSGIASERRLLDRARQALRRGAHGQARAALDAHRRRFPGGQLEEERESLTVRLLVATGQLERARAAARRFRRRFPRSILLPALDTILDSGQD